MTVWALLLALAGGTADFVDQDPPPPAKASAEPSSELDPRRIGSPRAVEGPIGEDAVGGDAADESTDSSSESRGRRPWIRRVLSTPSDLSNLFDRFHGTVSNELIERTDQIDQFFGDERLEDDPRVALLRLRQELVWAEKGETRSKTKFKARIPFRRLEKRFKLVIDSDSDEEELLGDELLEADPSPGENFTGVRYAVSVSSRSSVSVDVGGKFDDGFKARTELKLQRTWTTDEWRTRLFEGFSWRDGDGFGSRTRLDVDRLAGRFGRVRSRSQVDWEEGVSGTDLEQSFSIARAFNLKTAVSTGIGVFAHTRPSWIVDGYSAEVRMRRQFHRHWLFLELVPRARFPRDRRYEFTPELAIILEIRFGGALPTYPARDEPEGFAPPP